VPIPQLSDMASEADQAISPMLITAVSATMECLASESHPIDFEFGLGNCYQSFRAVLFY